MPTLKIQKADGTFEFLQLAGEEFADIGNQVLGVKEQLAQTENDLEQRSLNVSNFYRDFSETDDTGRLQRAFDKANTDGGIPVFIPKGTYTFTQLKLRNKLSFIGSGRSNTILNHTGNLKAFINESAGALGRITLSDFTLNLSSTCPIGIEFARVFGSLLSRIDINGVNPNGIGVSFDDGTVHSSYYNSTYDVSINGYNGSGIGLGTGFMFANSANSNRLVNCRTNYASVGVDIATDYCNHVVITGCAFEKFNKGVRLNGDLCQVIFSRFENQGGSPSGVGIEITPTSGGNVIIGNVMMNLSTSVQNNNPTGNNLIFNFDGLSVKHLSHESGGGWRTTMDMRNYPINNIGHVDLITRTSAPATLKGRMAFADGVAWNPNGEGEGTYINDGTLPRKVVTKRPVPTSTTSSGRTGEVAFDETYAYYCVAPSTWRRVALTTW